jgi:hypothetical protein
MPTPIKMDVKAAQITKIKTFNDFVFKDKTAVPKVTIKVMPPINISTMPMTEITLGRFKSLAPLKKKWS